MPGIIRAGRQRGQDYWLEEAFLIAPTGITGLAFADNRYETTDGKAPSWHSAD